MSQGPEKKRRGSVNYAWVLAGGYLVYLAVKIFQTLLAGESDAPVFGTIGGVVFAVVGALLLWREWSAYRYGQAHIDDPSTWSDEEYEPDEDETGKEVLDLPEEEASADGEEDA